MKRNPSRRVADPALGVCVASSPHCWDPPRGWPRPHPSAPTARGAPGCRQPNGQQARPARRSSPRPPRQYGVPSSVLLAVSFLESRWDDHGGSPSTAGGYGPMHLTEVSLPDQSYARGDEAAREVSGPASLRTVALASRLTALPARELRADPAANICGGAALLASWERTLSLVQDPTYVSRQFSWPSTPEPSASPGSLREAQGADAHRCRESSGESSGGRTQPRIVMGVAFIGRGTPCATATHDAQVCRTTSPSRWITW